MEPLNAIIILLNYTIIPALTYGSQLALGAIFVTLIYGILRFANFATGDMMSFGEPAKLPPRPLLDIGAAFNLWRWTRAARMER